MYKNELCTSQQILDRDWLMIGVAFVVLGVVAVVWHDEMYDQDVGLVFW